MASSSIMSSTVGHLPCSGKCPLFFAADMGQHPAGSTDASAVPACRCCALMGPLSPAILPSTPCQLHPYKQATCQLPAGTAPCEHHPSLPPAACHGIPISLPTTASLQHLTVPAADGAPYERMPSATSSGCGGSKSQSGDLLRLPSGNSQSGPPALDLSQSGSLAQELPVQRSPSNTIDEGDIVRQALEGTSVHK